MAKASKNDDVDPIDYDASPNAVWFKPVMITFLIIGLIWVMVFYLSGGLFPIPDIGGWNIAVGFGIAFIGFLMMMRWR